MCYIINSGDHPVVIQNITLNGITAYNSKLFNKDILDRINLGEFGYQVYTMDVKSPDKLPYRISCKE